jgi:Icc-related predicted phosphoesterase
MMRRAVFVVVAPIATIVATVVACASAPPAVPTAAPVVEPTGDVVEPPAPAIDDDAPPPPPKTFAEAVDRYHSDCPAPFFTLATPSSVTVGGRTFAVAGSTMTLTGDRVAGPLAIGVVGAVKDAEPETRENLMKAATAFAAAGVQVVLVPGDLTGNETAVIGPVVAMLDEVFAVPVLVHSGNYEWTSAFTDAVAAAPGLINLNIVRDVDVFGIHLLSLPGYFNRQFLQSGACHYDPDDVTTLATYAKAIAARGETVVLTSHGPPMGRGPGALDRTPDDEHVGDPQLNTLLEQGDIRFGIFSHILEAGGRAVTDIAGAEPLVVSTKKPMKTPVGRLYVNVGSASSFGWGMNDGSTSRGLAAIVTVDSSSGGSGRVVFLPLR